MKLLIYICPEYRKMIYHYNETPIFYSISGKGPVLVLLHGFLESSTMWSKLIPSLSLNKTVLTIDLPGHGKSGCLATTHTMEMMAEVLYALLNHLQIERASLIGHSMGGYVGLAFLESYGQKVEGFTLLNATTREDTLEQKRNRDRAARIVSENKEVFIGNMMNLLFTESLHRNYASEIAKLKKEAMGFSTKGIVATILGMKHRPDRTKVFRNFKGEKLMICGDKDLVVPISASKTIAASTNSKLTILKGGHMSWIENSAELLNLCT
ncbi:MAG: alpha/beta hydrolase [Bacteroidota bacterium]